MKLTLLVGLGIFVIGSLLFLPAVGTFALLLSCFPPRPRSVELEENDEIVPVIGNPKYAR
jgi:hypothetical protein